MVGEPCEARKRAPDGDSGAHEELVRRYIDDGHPFPREAAMFASGGSDEAAQRLLDELDTPRQPGTWESVSHDGLLTRPKDAKSGAPDGKAAGAFLGRWVAWGQANRGGGRNSSAALPVEAVRSGESVASAPGSPREKSQPAWKAAFPHREVCAGNDCDLPATPGYLLCGRCADAGGNV